MILFSVPEYSLCFTRYTRICACAYACTYRRAVWAELYSVFTQPSESLFNRSLLDPGNKTLKQFTRGTGLSINSPGMSEGSVPYNNLSNNGSGAPNNRPRPPDGSGPSGNDSPGMSWKSKVAIGATVGTVAGVGLAVATPTIILPRRLSASGLRALLKLALLLAFNRLLSLLVRGVCLLLLRVLGQSAPYHQ